MLSREHDKLFFLAVGIVRPHLPFTRLPSARGGGEELYAHSKDPDEWSNLANNPEYAEQKARLAAHLPQKEVPLVIEGIEKWSIPVSADKPIANK